MSTAIGDEGMRIAPAICFLCIWLVLLSNESICLRRTCTYWVSHCPLCPWLVMCTAYIVQRTELGLENLFNWVRIEKNKFFNCSSSELILSSPSLWQRCPTCLLVLLYVHLILLDPFLCSAVFQMHSAHVINHIFLPNVFLVWQSSVHSTEEPSACSGLTLLLCLFTLLAAQGLVFVSGARWGVGTIC